MDSITQRENTTEMRDHVSVLRCKPQLWVEWM